MSPVEKLISSSIKSALIAAGVALLAYPSAQAELTTYNDETAFQVELLRLGYTTVFEGFEDDAAWGAVRTTIVGGQMTAASVTSQGVTWTHNFSASPGNQITTGSGAARTGAYGFFALPHGNFSSPDACTLPGVCGDGFRGSSPSGTLLFAVGGWVSGSHGSKLGVFLDSGTTSVGFDNTAVGSSNQFFGVINTDGFNEFEFRELEGTKEDQKFLWVDDFTFGLAASGCGANSAPTAAFTFVLTDPNVAFTDTSSDTDGSVVEWFWDFGDGSFSDQKNPNHTYASNGTYSVVHYVRDDGHCSAASAPQMVLITFHAPADVAIKNPTNGATVSGVITIEVTVTDPPSEIEHVTYFIDGDEFDNNEEAPYSLTWDTTATAEGTHTLEARLTRLDKTEIWSDPVTFTLLNTPPTLIETWRGENFSAADLNDPAKEASIWGNAADPDQDGNHNWKEYAFGGDPLDPSDANLHVKLQITSGTGGETVLELTYWQRSNDPALTFTHQVSSDLLGWKFGPTYTTIVSAIPVNAEIQQVTFKDTGLGFTGAHYFGRVRVNEP